MCAPLLLHRFFATCTRTPAAAAGACATALRTHMPPVLLTCHGSLCTCYSCCRSAAALPLLHTWSAARVFGCSLYLLLLLQAAAWRGRQPWLVPCRLCLTLCFIPFPPFTPPDARTHTNRLITAYGPPLDDWLTPPVLSPTCCTFFAWLAPLFAAWFYPPPACHRQRLTVSYLCGWDAAAAFSTSFWTGCLPPRFCTHGGFRFTLHLLAATYLWRFTCYWRAYAHLFCRNY